MGRMSSYGNPAADFIERTLSLDELCIQHPAATFFVWAQGSSMEGAGIWDGDLLVVDRSIERAHRRIVVAAVDGEFVCKRLDLSNPKAPVLRAENPDYADIHLSGDSELDVFGVVTVVIRLQKP